MQKFSKREEMLVACIRYYVSPISFNVSGIGAPADVCAGKSGYFQVASEIRFLSFSGTGLLGGFGKFVSCPRRSGDLGIGDRC